jgi:putative phage-type endonuclease
MQDAISEKGFVDTRTLSREEWLKARKAFLGASEAGAVLGFNPYRSAYEVFVDKTSPEIQQQEPNDAIEFGLRLEPVIADVFMERTGKKVVRDNKIRVSGSIPFLSASLDRIIIPNNGEGRGVLEIKTVSSEARRQWEDRIPLNYFAQIQQQMFVAELQYGFFALLVDGRKFEVIEVAREDEYIQMQNAHLSSFWLDHVAKKVPPPKIVKDLELSNAVSEEVVEADQRVVDLHTRLCQVKLAMKPLKGQEEQLADELKLFMGERSVLASEGFTLATWKRSKDGVQFDEKRFRAEHPELYERFMVPKPGSRRFLTKGAE